MPAIHDTAPTEEEMDAMFFAQLDRDALDEHDSQQCKKQMAERAKAHKLSDEQLRIALRQTTPDTHHEIWMEYHRRTAVIACDARDEPDSRAEGTCLACAHGVHEAIEGASGCTCPCHAPATPRKQTNLREFYVDPYAFGLKLAGVR